MRQIAALLLFVPSLAIADASIPTPRAGERAFDESGIRCSGHHCDIERRVIDQMLSNVQTLASSARIVPHFVDGKPIGFKLYAIRPGSLFSRLLMQNGDTLLTLNGRDLSSPEKCLEIYTRLRSTSHLVLELQRHDRNLTLDYTIR